MSACDDRDLKASLGEPFWLSRQGVCVASLSDALVRSPDNSGLETYDAAQRSFKTVRLSGVSQADVEMTRCFEEKSKIMMKKRQCVIDYRGQFYQLWALAVAFFTFATAVVTPFEVAFVRDDAVLVYLNMILDTFFWCDMGVNFRLSFEIYDRKKGGLRYVDSSSEIVKHYVTGWFLLDFLSVFPFGLLGIGGVSKMRLLRCCRLVKLLRLLRGSRVITHLQKQLSVSYGVQDLCILML
jgi:hypothetical protein